ncbi:RNA polymerase sigma factor [Bacillus sp. B15-48]|uniref:RNA polymerase sigma factor n=1 Tax=Bacillus sp. B15-48 TaxID=1548601 RepID=UPI00193F01F5|nr:RNA polymerase sigma factor [Bacillus sp. B15-48]MBM4762759.1 sigma-70 family RNA polymerase sigma factor [Bacillus sp. B15-48]
MIDFEILFMEHTSRLTFIAYSITKDWYTSEDVVQEAFIKAYKNIDTIENIDKLGAWLSSITVRTAIDFLRAEKRRCSMSAEMSYIEQLQFKQDVMVSPEEEVEFILFKEQLSESVQQLPLSYQQVLILKLQYGLKEAEIADELQLKSTTVKTRLHRARKQLRHILFEKYPA